MMLKEKNAAVSGSGYFVQVVWTSPKTTQKGSQQKEEETIYSWEAIYSVMQYFPQRRKTSQKKLELGHWMHVSVLGWVAGRDTGVKCLFSFIVLRTLQLRVSSSTV